MESLIPSLVQSGAVGVIAYLLLQANREQEKAHQEAYRTLILQIQAGNDALRQQLISALEKNSQSLKAAAERLASLEATITATAHNTRKRTTGT